MVFEIPKNTGQILGKLFLTFKRKMGISNQILQFKNT
jgi:hypothetical protein